MTLPHEEVIDAHADGSIVHWDIKKEQNTQMEHFSIRTAQGDQIDHVGNNILNEILSLRNDAKKKYLKYLKVTFNFLTHANKATKKLTMVKVVHAKSIRVPVSFLFHCFRFLFIFCLFYFSY